MARFLITGSSGFIGGHLVRLALEQGHEVVATVRPSSDVSRVQNTGAQLVALPFADKLGLAKALRTLGRFDYVIHNAGVTKALKPEDYLAVNQGLTAHLIEVLVENDQVPEQFVFVSSLAAIGAAPSAHGRVTESQVPRPLTHYGKSKLAAELWIRTHAPDFPWVFARPTAVYGPADRDILQFIALINKGFEFTVGTTEQRLSFIYGPDAARAMLILAQMPRLKHHSFFLSDGKDYTTDLMCQAVRNATGRNRTVKLRIPLSVIRPIAAMVEQIGRMRGRPTALNLDKVAELSASNWLCDSTPLFQQTDFIPEHDLFTGMQATVDWYRHAKWL